jgi:hypothetical protein
MVDFDFPDPKELHDEHFPNERFSIYVRYRENEHSLDSFIGDIPKNTTYFLISCKKGWNSNTWNRLAEAYEKEGYETHLRKSSGTTKTRSGTCKHAQTQLYVW